MYPLAPGNIPFDGEGHVRLFRIRDGRVDYRSRYVRTERYVAQDKARRNPDADVSQPVAGRSERQGLEPQHGQHPCHSAQESAPRAEGGQRRRARSISTRSRRSIPSTPSTASFRVISRSRRTRRCARSTGNSSPSATRRDGVRQRRHRRVRDRQARQENLERRGPDAVCQQRARLRRDRESHRLLPHPAGHRPRTDEARRHSLVLGQGQEDLSGLHAPPRRRQRPQVDRRPGARRQLTRSEPSKTAANCTSTGRSPRATRIR